jgi:outer membrane protein OmpA-like peptidoglycan-associated protein
MPHDMKRGDGPVKSKAGGMSPHSRLARVPGAPAPGPNLMKNGTNAVLKGLRRDGTSRSQETDSMKFHSRALAGTALGLFMAASSASAAGLRPDAGHDVAEMPTVVAQADSDNAEQKLKKKERRADRQAEKNAGEQGGGGEQRVQEEQPRSQRQNKAERQQLRATGGQAEQRAQQAPANDEAPAIRPKKRHSDEAAGTAVQGGSDNEQPAMPKRKHRDRNEATQPTANQQAPENAQAKDAGQVEPDQGKKHRRNDKNAKRGEDNGQATTDKAIQPKAEQVQPEPKVERKVRQQPQNAGEDNANEAKPGMKNAGQAEQERKHGKNAGNRGTESGNAEINETGQNNRNGKNAKGMENGQPGESNAGTGQAAAPRPGVKPTQPDENAGNAGKMQNEETVRKDGGRNGENGRNVEGVETQGANGQAAQGGQSAEGGGNVVLPKSLNGKRAGEGQKRERRNAGEQNGNADNAALPDSARGRHGQRQEAGRGGKAEPLPDSDAAAQADFRRPERIESITAIEGKRVDQPERVYREHPRDVKVVKEVDDRTIVEVNNQIFVRGSDRPRITRNARDVYYEDLPNQRTREVVERRDGSRIVTIRNEYGDVIRRSRILPDNREIVLVYVDDRDLDRDRDRGWGDAGADLPPLVVDVPRDDYILEADDVRDPDRYYTFLEQPPVEPVQRLYSLGEVKRSARIRDIMPRIDLDTITFDFGSAEVGQDQADKLQSVADAIKKILDNNPAETFLIEGHTDAVGSDQANLVLSDERADSVASLLTSMFDIPSENLTTQGYGEEYLKVDTEEANRQNRRVTIRRITPLVAPVASAQ